jgi:hypothetical protein
MGSKTDQFEIDLLKCVSGQSTAGVFGSNVLTTFYGYFTTIPTDSTSGTEASHGGYGRVAVTGTMSTPAAGSMTNTGVVTFPAKSDVGTVTVTGWGIFSALTGGTLLYWSDLRDNTNSVTTKDLGNGDALTFAVGSITVTED